MYVGNDILIKRFVRELYQIFKGEKHCLWGKNKTKSEIMQMNLNGFMLNTSKESSGQFDIAISYLYFVQASKHLYALHP